MELQFDLSQWVHSISQIWEGSRQAILTSHEAYWQTKHTSFLCTNYLTNLLATYCQSRMGTTLSRRVWQPWNMPVLIAPGQAMEMEIFFLSFLYYCLKLDIWWKIAPFEAPQLEMFTPPAAMANIEETMPICPPQSCASSPWTIFTADRQFILRTKRFQAGLASEALFGMTMPALQTRRLILGKESWMNFKVQSTS